MVSSAHLERSFHDLQIPFQPPHLTCELWVFCCGVSRLFNYYGRAVGVRRGKRRGRKKRKEKSNGKEETEEEREEEREVQREVQREEKQQGEEEEMKGLMKEKIIGEK